MGAVGWLGEEGLIFGYGAGGAGRMGVLWL